MFSYQSTIEWLGIIQWSRMHMFFLNFNNHFLTIESMIVKLYHSKWSIQFPQKQQTLHHNCRHFMICNSSCFGFDRKSFVGFVALSWILWSQSIGCIFSQSKLYPDIHSKLQSSTRISSNILGLKLKKIKFP